MAGWNTVDYSSEDLISMQREAERRVREMQKQAKVALSGSAPQEENITIQRQMQPNNAQMQNRRSGENNTPMQTQNKMSGENNAPMQRQRTGDNDNSPNHATNNANIHNNQAVQGEVNGVQQQSSQNMPPNNMQTNGARANENKKKTGLLGNLLKGDLGNISGMLSGFLKNNREDTPLGKITSALNLDGEKLILIFLILLMLNEGEDYSLILALGYILL